MPEPNTQRKCLNQRILREGGSPSIGQGPRLFPALLSAVFSTWMMSHFTAAVRLPQFQTSHLLLTASVLEESKAWYKGPSLQVSFSFLGKVSSPEIPSKIPFTSPWPSWSCVPTCRPITDNREWAYHDLMRQTRLIP